MKIVAYSRPTTQYLVKVRKTRIPRQLVYDLLASSCIVLEITERRRPNNSIWVDHFLFFELYESSNDVYAMIEELYRFYRW